MELTLTRQSSGDSGTFGQIQLSGVGTLCTGELPWRGNTSYLSCIPTGSYEFSWSTTPNHPLGVYELQRAGNRSDIEIHIANWMGDVSCKNKHGQKLKCNLTGCIALGLSLDTTGDQVELKSSGDALDKFYGKMNRAPFTLKIVETALCQVEKEINYVAAFLRLGGHKGLVKLAAEREKEAECRTLCRTLSKNQSHIVLNFKNFKFSKLNLHYLNVFTTKYHLHCILSGVKYEGWISDIKALEFDYSILKNELESKKLNEETQLNIVCTGNFELSATNIKKDAADGIKDADSTAQKAAVNVVTPQAQAATAGAYKNASEAVQEALLGRPGAAGSAKAAAIYGAGVGLIQAAVECASGGLVTKPTLAMIAEAGQSEAVIPLSNLKSDPMRKQVAMEVGTYSANFPGVKNLSAMPVQSKSSAARQYLKQQQQANRRTGMRNSAPS